MAHSKQAQKRVRQNVAAAARNRPWRTAVSRRVRDARDAVQDGEANAAALVREAQSTLDQAARRGIIHPNAAARRKSRLARQLKQASAS